MQKEYNIRKNKSLNNASNFIELNKLNDRLTITNIETIKYNNSIFFGDKIEIEDTDLTDDVISVFIYSGNNYIGNLDTQLNKIRMNHQDIEI